MIDRFGREIVLESKYEKIQSIAEKIHLHVEKTSQPPTGNQNCQLCVWCSEAQIRGVDSLPRPVYSPRDTIFNIKGEDIVINPERLYINNINDIIDIISEGNNTRFYCHVNWSNSSGGHEILLLNIDCSIYIMDSQKGSVLNINTKVGKSYFENINYKNSYIVRLDDKEFNYDLFIKNNDISKTLSWDEKRDIEYMKNNDMLPKDVTITESKNDSNKGRLNEDGETVPELCTKCNSKVELYLRGEPVWCCSNKKCNKFYGVFPFSENKTIQEAALFNTKTFEVIDANIMSEDDYDDSKEWKNVDDLIAPLLQVCNKKGYVTKFSCSGHPLNGIRQHDGTITRNKSNDINTYIWIDGVYDFENIPNGWDIETDDPSGIIFRYRHRTSTPDMNYVEYLGVYSDIIKQIKIMCDYFSKLPDAENNRKGDNNMAIKKLPSRFKDEHVQEAMFDAGFNNLRFKLAEALNDKFKISNIMRAVGMNSDKFVISSIDDDDIKINVINMNNGVKVPGYFNNISLSRAFDKIVELLTSPQFLVEYSVDMVDDNDEPDISSFGKHNGDDLPNNEYDTKEVETLNELIASESGAMSEYFNASKNSKIDVLRRLYSDIGEEERFHTEQLLHAKSVITGEKYEPRDPEVKKEYEELLELGMDEETALNTVSDRFSISKSIDDEADDVNMEELENDINILEHAITQYDNYIDELEIISESTTLTKEEINNELNKHIEIFAGSYFISEAVDNVSDTSSSTNNSTMNPINLIIRGARAIYKFITQLIRKIRIFIRRVKVKQAARNEWIKAHGIKGLFEPGISMYFYNDKHHGFVSTEPIRYVELMYDVTREIGKRMGIPDTGQLSPSRPRNYERIKFNTISRGLDLIKGVVLSKSKIIVNKTNEAGLAEMFFGYSPIKVGENPKSNNVYNSLEAMADVTESFTKVTESFVNKVKNLESDPHSIYYKNRNEYDKAIDSFKIVMKGFSVFSKALAHDMSVIMRLNNGILEETNNMDRMDNNKNSNDKSNQNVDDSMMKW